MKILEWEEAKSECGYSGHWTLELVVSQDWN